MIKSAETNEEILSRIGHDLKGMLARIRSCNYTLYKSFENNLDDDTRKFFETIERDCTSIKSIIHNLISVDRSFEEDALQEPRIVVINQLLRDVVSKFPGLTTTEKDIRISFEDLEEEISIYIDENAIRRVLEQLLSNAFKFSRGGTHIVVKLVKYANVANISVSDQGIGIPKKLRPYIFNKFSKATRRGTEGEESSGLGLYLAKNIVERHQGSIWYESEEGQGTNVYINLPVRDRV
jgi:signal transduction histidine kinase